MIHEGQKVVAICDDREVRRGMVGRVIGVQGSEPSVLVKWFSFDGRGVTGKQYAGYYDDTRSSFWVNRGSIEPTDGKQPLMGKGFMHDIVQSARRLALKATNPSEYELRQAGIVDDCGRITSAGVELLHAQLLENTAIRAALVAVAKGINEEKK